MNVYKLNALPATLEGDSLYYILDGDDSQAYITSNAGVAKNVTNAIAILGIALDKLTVDGGTTGQVLSKVSDTDFDFEWVNNAGGGGGVTSVNTRTGDVVLTSIDVNLGNADNTSDANKPVSTATQTALDFKIPFIYLSPQTLTDAATIAYDVDNGVNAIVTITADRTLAAITNAAAGQSGALTVIQGGAGGWTLTLDASQTDLLGTLADIAALATGEEAEIAWRTIDGANFKFWITA